MSLPDPPPRPTHPPFSSLTGYFTGTPEARAAVRAALVARPKLGAAPLLAPPRTRHYGLVGTAFDYLLRARLMREHLGRTLVHGGSPKVASLARMDFEDDPAALQLLDDARAVVTAFEGGERPLDPEVARACLVLATFDVVIRTGRYHELVGEVDDEDVQDLLRLGEIVPLQAFQADRRLLLNPLFHAAGRVGGADADLLLDDTLIEIKTTMHFKLPGEYLQQLAGYLVSWVADGSDFVQPPDTTGWQQTGFVLTTPAIPQDIPITLSNLSSTQNPKSCFFDDVRFGPLVGDAEPVQADIDPDITAPTQFAGEEASFSAGSSSGDDLSFHWDFGDGASADGSDTTHQYTTPGRYTVTLTVQDASGTTSSTTTSVAVMPGIHDIPDSRVTVLGTPTTFDVRYPVPGLTYNWDFGDGQTATGARVQHAYTARGFQDVRLTVYDDRAAPSPDGSHPIVTQQDTRVNNIVPLPSAWIDGASTGGNGVYLSAEQSQGATALTYQWDFGDGSSGSGPTVQHTYVDNGRYPITLTATDTYGQTGVAHQVLLIGTTAEVVNNAVTVNLGDGSSAARGALRAQGVRVSDPQVQAALDRAHKRAQKGVLILKGRMATTSGRLRSQSLTTLENAFPFALPVRPADITDTFTADGFGSSISEASASAAWNGTTRARGNGWDLTACTNGQCASAVLSRDFFPPALPDGVSRQSFTFKTSASSPDTQTLVTNMAAYSGLRVPHVLLSIVPDTQLADITEHEYRATIDGREQYLLQVNVPESGITQDGFIGFNVPLYAVDASGQVAENVSGAFNAQFLGQNVYSASAEGVMVRGRADMIVYVPIAAFSDGGTQFDLTQVLVTSDPNCNEDDNYAAVGLVLQGCQTIQATHDVPQFGQASGLKAQSLGAQAQPPSILPFSYAFKSSTDLLNKIILGATVSQRASLDRLLRNYEASHVSTAVGLLPFLGDGADLLIQGYRNWEGQGLDPVVVTFAAGGFVVDVFTGAGGEELSAIKKVYQLSKRANGFFAPLIANAVRGLVEGGKTPKEVGLAIKDTFGTLGTLLARDGWSGVSSADRLAKGLTELPACPVLSGQSVRVQACGDRLAILQVIVKLSKNAFNVNYSRKALMEALVRVCCSPANGGEGYIKGAEYLLERASKATEQGGLRGIRSEAKAGGALRHVGFTEVEFPKEKSFTLSDGRTTEPDLIAKDRAGQLRVFEVKTNGSLDRGQESGLLEMAQQLNAKPSFVSVERELPKKNQQVLRRLGIDVLDLQGNVLN